MTNTEKKPDKDTLTAWCLGTIAFHKGIDCAPVLDPDLRELLNPEIGTNEDILKAWIKGWTTQSLSGTTET